MTLLEIRPLRPDEIELFVQSCYYAFKGRSVEQRRLDFAGRVAPERNVLVAFENGELVAHVMIYEFATWIGGARYPTGGLANVVTAPERARRGYASQVLRETLRWMRDELGQCLSTLYPTVYPLYRGLGWSLADDTRHLAGPPAAFRPNHALPHDSGARLVRRLARPEDLDLIRPVYDRFVRERSGYLDRPRWWWEARVLRTWRPDPSWLALWYGSDGELAGYVAYWFEGPNGTELTVYDVVALRPEAYQGILTFLASHNLVNEVRFTAGSDVPWRLLVANPHLLHQEIDDKATFMLRVVDFPRALALRPAPVERLEPVRLRVIDADAPWNDGVWEIHAEGGHWHAVANGAAAPQAAADISTVSSLFSGIINVDEAIDAGLLAAPERARRALASVFHCPYRPTSRDHF